MKKVKINSDKPFILKIKVGHSNKFIYKAKLREIIGDEKFVNIVFSGTEVTQPVPPPPPPPRHIDSATPK